MIRILIADDHGIMRGGLKQIVALTTDIVVVGEASDGEQTLAQVRNQEFDLILLDMSMPGISGIELIQRLRHLQPALPILILSMSNERQIVSRAIKSGAAGYVTKDVHPEVLLSAIRKVAAGGRFVDTVLLEDMLFMKGSYNLAPHELLSDRESQIFQMLVSGRQISEIAAMLHLSPKTVSTYKTRLMQKLEINNSADLVRYAIQHGLAQVVPVPDQS
ncbi:MAG: response regulator transcription factor [Betaproteobacteria bacterium]|nr:response regulator transcription factor [Betaproteobacteria bacterium]